MIRLVLGSAVAIVVGVRGVRGVMGVGRTGKPVTNHVVRVADIEGMAHLVAVNPEREGPYLVNNRIDIHTWSDIHDGISMGFLKNKKQKRWDLIVNSLRK